MHRSLGDCLAFAYTILVGMAERGREEGEPAHHLCGVLWPWPLPLFLSPRDGIPLIRASHSIEMPRHIGFRTKVRKCACLIGTADG